MEPEPNVRPILVFALGQEMFGVRLDAVREIFDTDYLQPVPRAPALIRGLADVRGRMVTVLDLATLLGAGPPSADSAHPMLLSEPRDHLALGTSTAIDLWNLDFDTLTPWPGGEGMPEIFDGYVTSDRAIVNIRAAHQLVDR